ncbi:MAG: hypothetical protein KJ906_01945 [Nanoarchaeota archaeon]|nr:hypothetical protein [Nanoarchaeota archaeon]
MDLSIFTYSFDMKTLKKLGIDSPTLLCGTMNLDLDVSLNLKHFKQYKSKGFKPIPMLDVVHNVHHQGNELIINKTTLKNVKKWCHKLAKISDHIMLDLEPVREFQIPLYKEIRKQYPYRITGCFGQTINKNILKYVDDSVYMFYDYSTDLNSYKRGIKEKLNDILNIKKPFGIGVPIASSFNEFEKLVNKQGDVVLRSPYKMKEYTEVCLKVLKSVKNNSLFKGITLWGLYDQAMERRYLYYYPYKIQFNLNLLLKKCGFMIKKI